MTHYLVSQSMLGTYEKCPRQFYYRYILEYEGEQVFISALDFGTQIHSILEKLSEVPKDDREEVGKNLIYNLILEVDGDDSKDYESRLLKLLKPLIRVVEKYKIHKSEYFTKQIIISPEDLTDNQIDALRAAIERKRIRKGWDERENVFEGVMYGGYVDAFASPYSSPGTNLVIDWKTGFFSRDWISKYERQSQLYTHCMRLENFRVDGTKIVYVEQDMEHSVDHSEEKCKEVFDEMIESFKEILSGVNDIHNFPMVENDPYTCIGCNYNFICYKNRDLYD